MALYSSLSRAGLSVEYLHTNSTTHEFLFGAIAELVDNARDAEATTCHIFSMEKANIRANKMICFLDNGCGMSSKEAAATITFGYSNKRKNDKMIGQYGNGLKSGAMRIGRDLILFTKKDGVMTVVFLCRTFFELEKLTEVVVPMPSYNAITKQPYFENEDSYELVRGEKEKHKVEMELIYKYSPFKCYREVMHQFDMITGTSGTLICVYNLRVLDDMDLELDFSTDPKDIRIAGVEPKDVVPERYSLRAYLAVIYFDPRMKIYIQDKKIRTRRIASCLFEPRQFRWSSARFKARAEKDVAEAKIQMQMASDRVKDVECKYADFQEEYGLTPADRSIRIELHKLHDELTTAKADSSEKEVQWKEKCRALNEPKDLSFIFGMTLDRRDLDGLFVYNNGRLIKMYEKPITKKRCRGVVGFLDVPYLVLEPTHNKQDFADEKEFRTLIRAMSEYMESYYIQTEKEYMKTGATSFWKKFGYASDDWEAASMEDQFVRARKQAVSLAIQCDCCLKWRDLPYDSKYDRSDPPDDWVCKDNPDRQFNKCTVPERKAVFKSAEFKREEVSVEQRQETLRREKEKLSKKEAELKRMETLKPVRSAKDVAKLAQQSRITQVTQASTSTASNRKSAVENAKATRTSARVMQRPAHYSPPPSPQRKSQGRSRRSRLNSSDMDEDYVEVVDSRKKKSSIKSSPKIQAKTYGNGKQSGKIQTAKKSVAVVDNFSDSDVTELNGTNAEDSDVEDAIEIEPVGKRPRLNAAPTTSTIVATSPSTDGEVKKNGGNNLLLVKVEQAVTLPISQMKLYKTEDGTLLSRVKHVLAYFSPPNSKYPKDKIYKMSPNELMSIDLREYIQQYEIQLKELLSKKEEAYKERLLTLRRNAVNIALSCDPNCGLIEDQTDDDVDHVMNNLAAEAKNVLNQRREQMRKYQ